MTSQQAYEDLISHVKRTTALQQVEGLLSWDQETMMPPRGAEARAEQMAAMSSVTHAMNRDERIGEWLSNIDQSTLDAVAAANVREVQRSYHKAKRIPARLSEELARQTALSPATWARARQENDLPSFLRVLETMITLKREEASCLADGHDELYDALLDGFEPGMTVQVLKPLLNNMRPALAELRALIEDSPVNTRSVTGRFPEARQMEMANRLATVFNYDWQGGRIDKAVHPFSSGYRSDSRITTRVNPDNPFDCFYSTIHEVGHSNYEQGRDPAMDRTPAGSFASMGVHESQSRMLENQIGRSRAFMEWLYPQMVELFDEMPFDSPEALYRTVNHVEPGFIRTEADEVHYNLHILLRFDLELALFRGDLTAADLEAAWNDRFKADFGVEVDRAANGVLQDIHWSMGLFGYFPTYSLGNIYAAELFEAMGHAIPDRDERIARGDLGELSRWLVEHVHRHGHIYAAAQLVENAIEKVPDEKRLLAYLSDKFSDLYAL